MEIINQHTKKIMEHCKERARDAGLSFDDESLEYIVTNRDMLELSPKVMIPTLYDYWVHDLHVLQGKGRYKLYPHNAYETVINSRPGISFYNDNNPDWLNVMIFYHVLGHIDFFQNNCFFQPTWDDDFVSVALTDKRLIADLRAEHGRWVDYVIEFSRGVDNLVDYHGQLADYYSRSIPTLSSKLDFYFNHFLKSVKGLSHDFFLKELERYNDLCDTFPDESQSLFFSEIQTKHPEFEAAFEDSREEQTKPQDLLQFLMEESPFLNKKENVWMKQVMQVVRNTALYFSPQMRTKIFNEGWASYWHQTLFEQDPHLKGHELDYSVLDAEVTSLQRVGLNPYAIGLRLINYVEELANKGKLTYDFKKIQDSTVRKEFDLQTGEGRDYIFKLRSEMDDFNLVNHFLDQDFVDKHNLFVVGRRINWFEGTWEYYVKSRKAEDYKQQVLGYLPHPPKISWSVKGKDNNILLLDHEFEGKQLVQEMIPNTMIGLEYLWGGTVTLRSVRILNAGGGWPWGLPLKKKKHVLYKCKNKKVTSKILGDYNE